MPDKSTEKILGFSANTHYAQKSESEIIKNYRGLARYHKGFSLIELMVAMSLFSFCLLAIMSLQVKALAILSDANLKNQAVILAASRHELHKISSKKIYSQDVLKLNWNRLIKDKIPQVKIVESKLDDDMHISLVWPSSHTSGKCNNNNKNSFDCFQL